MYSCFNLFSNISKFYRERPVFNVTSPGRDDTQGCHRGNKGSFKPRLLQSNVPGPKEGRGCSASNRFKKAKFLYRLPSFQNGVGPVSKAGHKTWGMAHQDRPSGCLLPCVSQEDIQEVPEVHLSGQSFSIQSPSIWPKYCTKDFHGHNQTNYSLSQVKGNKSSFLSRRLVEQGRQFHRSKEPYSAGGMHSARIRFFDKFQKIHTHPKSVNGIPRVNVRPEQRYCSTVRRERNKTYHFSKGVSKKEGSYSSVMSKIDRFNELHGRSYSYGTGTSQTNSILAPKSMENAQGSTGVSFESRPRSTDSSCMVVQKAPFSERLLTDIEPSKSNNLCRRLKGGVGWTPGNSDSPGYMVTKGVQTVHQLEGIDGSLLHSTALQKESVQSACPHYERQFNCNTIPKEVRGHKISDTLSTHMGHSAFLSQELYNNNYKTHSRVEECLSRQTVQTNQDHSNRVVFKQVSFHGNPSEDGSIRNRSVCNERQCTTSELCLPNARQTGNGSGCTVHKLGGMVRDVCIPSTPNNAKGTAESQRVYECNSSPNSPSLAQSVMVSQSSGDINRSTLETTQSPRTSGTVSGGIKSVSSDTSCIPVSRLENIKQQLIEEGFSQDAAVRMAKPQRDSTIAVYEGKWQHYRDWCDSRHINPFKANVPQLAEYFLFLFNQVMGNGKRRAVKTIEGYRSALAAILKKEGRDISQSQNISNMFRNFSIERPVMRKLIPQWNLSVVLNYLLKEPFEPILHSSLENLSYKTVFLTALATGRRRSEIHALSVDKACLRFSRGLSSVTLLPEPGFLAKNQIPNLPPQKMIIPSLIAFTGKDIPDYKLCPVRALKSYVTKTSDPSVRKGRDRLFIPFNKEDDRDLSVRTISVWICKLIRRAYENTNKEMLSISNVKAHEVRALATSWAYFNKVPFTEIMQAAYWRGNTTFANFYLRSLANHSDDLYALGPIVSAQQVVQDSCL